MAGLLSRRLKTGIAIPIRQKDAVGYLDSGEILAFRIKARKTYAITPAGEILTDCSMNKIRPRLKALGGWVPIGRNYTVNLNLIHHIGKQKGVSGHILTFTDGTRLTLLPGYEKKVREFFNADRLDRINPLSRPFEYLLEIGVRQVDTDIRFTPTEKLKEVFSTVDGDNIVVSDLVASFLWQQVNYIRQGKPSIVANKNVRSLWYAIGPVLGRLGVYTDHYKTVCEQLSNMATNHVLRYAEFKLRENGIWNLGPYNPNIIVLNEKEADDAALKEVQDLTGVTYIATGGQPSTLTMEYFSAALKKRLAEFDKNAPLIVIAIVDYDPHGWALRETAIKDMINFGLPEPEQVINLAVPKNYNQDMLPFLKNDLTKGKYKVPKSMLRKWMKLTGGINGEPYGISINYLWEDIEHVKRLIIEAGKPYFTVQPPVPIRAWEEAAKSMQRLHAEALFSIQTLRKRS